jgi:hypothetical protein
MLKRDPEHHPTRFLAAIWEQCLAENFGIAGTHVSDKDQEMGQLKYLRNALGDLTQPIVEWMLKPENWCHFCQQVRAESGMHYAPPHPQIGFLLRHRGRALKIMRRALRHSTTPADIAFCTKLDRLRYEQLKTLALVYAEGIPERVAKIEAAKTLIELQRAFLDTVDESIGASASPSPIAA